MKGVAFFEMFFLTALSVLLLAAFYLTPLFAVVLYVAAPAPFAVLTARFGVKRAVLCGLAAMTFVFFSPWFFAFVAYFFMFILPGVLFGAIFGRVSSGASYMMFAVPASLVSRVALFCLFFTVMGRSVVFSPETEAMTANFLARIYSLPADEAARLAKLAGAELTARLPAFFIIFAAAESLFSCLAAKFYLKRFCRTGTAKSPSFPPFTHWRFPANIFWALLAALVFDMLERFYPQEAFYKIVSLNMIGVLRALFLVEGVSLLWYFMSVYKINKFMRFSVAAFCVIFAPVSYALSMVGVFDIWYDLRGSVKLRRRKP